MANILQTDLFQNCIQIKDLHSDLNFTETCF